MNTDRTFIIYSAKDRTKVEKYLKKNGISQSRSFDNVQDADAVIYFHSSGSESDPLCQENLKTAGECGIPVRTVELDFPVGTIIAGIFLVAVLLFIGYVLFARYVPNLKGMDRQQAAVALKEYGFPAKFIYEYSSEAPAGQAVGQDKTEKWIPLLPVTVTISLGEKKSLKSLPDTEGMSLSEALKALRDAGFTRCSVSMVKSGSHEPGTVSSQSVPGGYEISEDSRLGLIAEPEDELTEVDAGGQTVLMSAGDSLEIDLAEGTGKLTEAYVPKNYENAAYIHGVGGQYTENDQKVYDQPVIIDGDNNSVILLFQGKFNDDVLIRTGNNAVFIYVGDCEFKGNIYFENDIMQASEKTILPAIVTDHSNIAAEVLHGSAAFYMIKKDTTGFFNGVEYRYDDKLEFEDLSSIGDIAPGYVSFSTGEPNMHLVKQRCHDGEVSIEHKKSHLDKYF